MLLIITRVIVFSGGNTDKKSQSDKETDTTNAVSTTKENPAKKFIEDGDSLIKTVEDYVGTEDITEFDESMYSNLDKAKDLYEKAKEADTNASVDDKLARVEELRVKLDEIKRDIEKLAFVGEWACYEFQITKEDVSKGASNYESSFGTGHTFKLNKDGTFEQSS